METITIKLGQNVELIIDEPSTVSCNERPLLLTSAIVHTLSDVTNLNPSLKAGFFPLTIGSTVYRIYYQLRVKRLTNALALYSDVISHIQDNPHLYDQRLASKAIQVLRECYINYLT